MIKLAIVDDDALIRESLSILIDGKQDIKVCALGKNGEDALRLCKYCDVMLLDLRMPIKSGLDVLEEVSKHTKVLVLTTFDEQSEILQSLKYGAHGYLLKSATPESIINAIVEIHKGKNVYDTVVMEHVRRNMPENKEKLAELSDREDEIVSLIADGYSNKQIAKELFLSEGTVKNHVTSILQKTGLEHRTQIAIYRLRGEL